MLPGMLGVFPDAPFHVCAWVKCAQSTGGSGGTLLPPWMVDPPGVPGQSTLLAQDPQS